MIIRRAVIDKFSSYNHLEFEFNNKGLTLISGPTGSGKSTLCDIIPWALFGKTAKNGSVDEVIQWGTTETTAMLELELPGKGLIIWRSRKPNDLFFHINGGSPIRGKDLNDTQKLLELELGFTYDTYTSGAYFHEFSQSASFFTATAKIRRSIIEQLVDLSFAKNIQEKASPYLKTLKNALVNHTNDLTLAENNFNHQSETLRKELFRNQTLKEQKQKFEADRDADIVKLTTTYIDQELILMAEIMPLQESLAPDRHYQELQALIKNTALQLEQLGTKICNICGSDTNDKERVILTSALNTYQTLVNQQDKIATKLNHLSDKLSNIRMTLEKNRQSLLNLKNPFTSDFNTETLERIVINLDTGITKLKAIINKIKVDISDVELLQDITETFRASQVTNAVSELETQTNRTLSTYFDAEIRVSFNLESSDKIDVLIYKDGNEASYTQLSKGQRQLLKLSFGLAVMKMVQLHNNFSFNAIFLDEALDGLDDSLKVKAYDLLSFLSQSYSSVFVVEHNETLKTMFPSRIEVELINGMSQLEKT